MTPMRVLAERVRELRKRRGMTAQQLAEEMSAVGIPWERVVVTKLETGKRQSVSVQELLALAFVLSASPIHLLFADDETSEPYQLLPALPTAQRVTRRWFRGGGPLYEQDFNTYVSAVPSTDPDKFWANFPELRAERGEASDG